MSDPTAGDPAAARVLHVDDEPDFAELAAEFMRRQDGTLEIETESDPEAALRRIEDNRIDCVVSDYDMPELSGLDLLREIRAEDPDLPFILFTGKGSEEVASDAISAGVTDYLQKEGGTDQYAILVNRIRNAVERHRARQAVEKTEVWARTLLAHSSDFLFVVDGSGIISYISPSIQRVMGYLPDEVTGANAFDFIHPEDVSIAEEAFTEALESPGEAVTVEYRALDADGGTRWLEVRGRNLLEDPVIEGVLVNARDVTDRHRSEEKRRESERRYRALLESSDDAIARIAFDGETPVVQECNAAFEALFVPEGEAATGRDIDDLVAGEGRREAARELSQRVRAGEAMSGRLRRDTLDGPEEFVWRAVPIERPDGGAVESAFAIYTPIADAHPVDR